MVAITVVRTTNQIQDGVSYEGKLTVEKAEFIYQLTFTTPIPELKKSPPIKSAEEMREKFVIEIAKKGSAPIEMQDDEYKFFILLLLRGTLEYYFSPHTRLVNEQSMQHLALQIGASLTGHQLAREQYTVTEKIVALLNAPKFGCGIVY